MGDFNLRLGFVSGDFTGLGSSNRCNPESVFCSNDWSRQLLFDRCVRSDGFRSAFQRKSCEEVDMIDAFVHVTLLDDVVG